jgi:hypothetical protein
MIGCTKDRYEEIPSILERQLKKSVEMTKRVTPSVTVEQPHQDNESNALDRLKKLVAETKEMVAQVEALAASMRCPQDCYKPHGR